MRKDSCETKEIRSPLWDEGESVTICLLEKGVVDMRLRQSLTPADIKFIVSEIVAMNERARPILNSLGPLP